MDEFFRVLLESNPFSHTAVHEVADAAVDVETVHQGQFDYLVARTEEIRASRGHEGHVVWGEPGTGKSHLLARLSRWGDRNARACCFLLHPLVADPDEQARHVVASVIRQMTCDPSGNLRRTPLYRLVRAAVEQAMARLPAQSKPYRVWQVYHAFRRLVDRRLPEGACAGFGGRRISGLLFRFFSAAERHEGSLHGSPAAQRALQLLSGESLEPIDTAGLAALGAWGAQRPKRRSEAAAARRVLLALAELASLGGRAMVLCFDQVDALAPEQVRALGRFLHPLIDHGRNLLVVVSGEQEALLDYADRGVIARTAWDRLAHDPAGIVLGRIPAAQAKQILEARLRSFVEPFLTLCPVRQRVEQDPLFPLGSDWCDEQGRGLTEFRARDVLQWARRRWSEQQARLRDLGGPAWLDQCCPSPAGTPEPVIVHRPGTGTFFGPLRAEKRACPLAAEGDVGPAHGALAWRGPAAQTDLREPARPATHAEPDRRQAPSPPRPEDRKMEYLAWTVVALLFVAIGLVLWGRSGADDRQTLADSSGPSAPIAVPPPREPSRMIAQGAPLGQDRIEQNVNGALDAATPSAPRTVASQAEGPPAVLAPAAPAQRATPRAPPSRSVPVQTGVAGTAPPTQAVASVPSSVAHRPAATASSTTPVASPQSASAPGDAAGAAAPGRLAAAGHSSRAAGPREPAAGDRRTVTVARAASDATAPAAGNRYPSNVLYTVGSGSSRPPTVVSTAAQPPVKPMVVIDDPEVEQLLAEAWGLIERGDHGPGRSRLLKARTANRDDPRADFSLGLLEGLIHRDWGAAEKRFAECVRYDRENVPSLNNLAVALVHNHREAEALRHWKTIVDQRAATADVVQNLGFVRHLIKEGVVRRNSSLVKELDEVYTEAAVATSQGFQPGRGFRLMALRLSTGRSVGWANPTMMADRSMPKPIATRASSRRKAAQAAAPAETPATEGPAGPSVAPAPAGPYLYPRGPQRANMPVYLPGGRARPGG